MTVVRTGGGDGKASVDYATSGGTASAGDFSGAAGTLVWAPGQTGAMSLILDVVDDATFEGDETIELSLREANGATVGAPATATITIVDDDDAARGTVGFVLTSHSADETQGTLQLAVTRAGGSDGPISVRYRTQDIGAVAGSDYAATTGVVTWADGEAAPRMIPLQIHDDQTREGSESFAVSLFDYAGGATPGNATALVTITDDEGPSYGSLGVASDTLTVTEPTDSIEIAVSRTGGSHGVVSVDYATRTVSAKPGTDYDETAGTLAWGDGDDEDKLVRVEIHDDSDFDPDEAFQLELSAPTGGAALGAPAATVTIVDDEIAIPGLLSFAEVEYSATEEDALVTLLVARTGGDGEVTVKYDTLAETAGNGDYTSVSGRMRWADGDVSLKRIDIPITQDSELEKDETFSLVLSEVTGGAAIDRGSALVTIIDDDEAVDPGTDPDPDPSSAVGAVGFVEEAVTINESDGKLSILVERAQGSAGPATVDWLALGGTAVSFAKPTSESLETIEGSAPEPFTPPGGAAGRPRFPGQQRSRRRP